MIIIVIRGDFATYINSKPIHFIIKTVFLLILVAIYTCYITQLRNTLDTKIFFSFQKQLIVNKYAFYVLVSFFYVKTKILKLYFKKDTKIALNFLDNIFSDFRIICTTNL